MPTPTSGVAWTTGTDDLTTATITHNAAEETASQGGGSQLSDADLTAIANLDATTAGTIGSDGAGWVKKTYAQFKTALGLVKADLGLGSVDNVADSAKPVSTAQQSALDLKINTSAKGAASGVAELDGSGFVPTAQLPAYVDDVIEAANFAALPGTGTTGKVYVTLDDNKTFRWSGSAYVEISASLALGETSGTAYRGDRGKTAYDHSQLLSGNPHAVTKTDLSLNNVDNTTDAAKPVSTATQTALDLKSATTHTHPNTAFTNNWRASTYYFANSASVAATSNALANGNARVTPVVFPSQVSIATLGAEFTAAGDTVSMFRIGVWNDDGSGRPGTLAVDAGTISTGSANSGNVATGGTAGNYEITLGTTLVLPAGLYWFGGAVQNVTTTQPTMRTVNAPSVLFCLPLLAIPSANSANCGFAMGSQTGAFGTYTASSATAVAARIFFKTAT